MLQVVPSQDVFDTVDGLGMSCFGVTPQVGQAALLNLNRIGNVNDFEVANGLAGFNSMAIDPEVLAELGGIAAIGFSAGAVLRLNQHDAVTAKVTQHLDQPVVKATNFDDRPKPAVGFGTASGKLLEELEDFLWTGADLSF